MTYDNVYIKVSHGNEDAICTLEQEDFEENSLKTTASATNGSGFNIGNAVMKQLSLTLTRVGLAKMRDSGALRRKYKMSLYQDNGSMQDKLFGSFYIAEMNVFDYYATITAYDIIYAFDKKITQGKLIELRTQKKTLKDWFSWCCENCRDDNYDIRANLSPGYWTVNSDVYLNISEDSNIDTYRDCLQFIAGLGGGFFESRFEDYIDGAVTLVKFSDTVREDIEVEPNEVLEFSEDTFECIIVRIETSIGGFDYSTPNLLHDPKYDGLILSIYENPFLRSFVTEDTESLPEQVKTIFNNSYGKLQGMTFYGGSVNIPQRDDVFLGDRIKVKRKIIPEVIGRSTDYGDIATETVESSVLVTDLAWGYKNNLALKCNPSTENRNPSSAGLNKGNGYNPSKGSKTKDTRLDKIARNLTKNLGKKSFGINGSAFKIGQILTYSDLDWTYSRIYKGITIPLGVIDDTPWVDITNVKLDTLCALYGVPERLFKNNWSDKEKYNGYSLGMNSNITYMGVLSSESDIFNVRPKLTEASCIATNIIAGLNERENYPYKNKGKMLVGSEKYSSVVDKTYEYESENRNVGIGIPEKHNTIGGRSFQLKSEDYGKEMYLHIFVGTTKTNDYNSWTETIGSEIYLYSSPIAINCDVCTYKELGSGGEKEYEINSVKSNSGDLFKDVLRDIELSSNLEFNVVMSSSASVYSLTDNEVVDTITDKIINNDGISVLETSLDNYKDYVNTTINDIYERLDSISTDGSGEPSGDIEEILKQIDELKTLVNNLSSAVAINTQAIQTIESTIGGINHDIDNLIILSNAHTDDIKDLEKRVDKLEQGGGVTPPEPTPTPSGSGLTSDEYLNSEDIEIVSYGSVGVVDLDLVTTKGNAPVIQFNMSASVVASGLLEFSLKFNNKQISFKPKVFVEKEYELISFSVPLFSSSEDKRATLSITCTNTTSHIICYANGLSITILNASLPKPNNEFEYDIDNFVIASDIVLFNGATDSVSNERG